MLLSSASHEVVNLRILSLGVSAAAVAAFLAFLATFSGVTGLATFDFFGILGLGMSLAKLEPGGHSIFFIVKNEQLRNQNDARN